MLENTVKRTLRHLRRRGLLRIDEEDADPDVPGDPENNLAASAVSGRRRDPLGRWGVRASLLSDPDSALPQRA